MDVRVLSVLALVPLLAGCVGSCNPAPPVSARGIDVGTPSVGGDGSFYANVTITQEPGGPALAGAGVVFFWGDEDSSAAQRGDRPVVHVGAQGDSGNAEVDVGLPTASPPDYTKTLPLRTDAAGHVTARLPASRIVGFVAAADGWTEEWIPALATGSAGNLRISMPLYHDHLAVDLPGTLSPGAASSSAVTGNIVWYPQDAKLGSTPGATAGYLARLTGIEATLNWTNSPPLSFGDLALAVGPADSQPTLVRDSSTDTALGDRTQSLEVKASDVRDRGLLGATHLYLGPGTRSGYLGPMGLPYTLHAALSVDREQAFRSQCGGSIDVEQHSSPGAGLWLAAALMGAAFLARRKA